MSIYPESTINITISLVIFIFEYVIDIIFEVNYYISNLSYDFLGFFIYIFFSKQIFRKLGRR